MNKRVTDREFVEAWLASADLQQCSVLLAMKPSGASARANRLRRAGVNLPKFARHPKQPKAIDVDGLNALISEKESE